MGPGVNDIEASSMTFPPYGISKCFSSEGGILGQGKEIVGDDNGMDSGTLARPSPEWFVGLLGGLSLETSCTKPTCARVTRVGETWGAAGAGGAQLTGGEGAFLCSTSDSSGDAGGERQIESFSDWSERAGEDAGGDGTSHSMPSTSSNESGGDGQSESLFPLSPASVFEYTGG